MHVGHVRQSNMVQGSELEVRWPLWARSGVVFACALVLLGGCANNSGSRAPVTDLNSSSSATARTYVIKAGDTVNKIARATGVDEATSIEDLGHTEGDGVVRVAATLVDVQKDVVLLKQLRVFCLGPDVITPVQSVVPE